MERVRGQGWAREEACTLHGHGVLYSEHAAAAGRAYFKRWASLGGAEKPDAGVPLGVFPGLHQLFEVFPPGGKFELSEKDFLCELVPFLIDKARRLPDLAGTVRFRC